MIKQILISNAYYAPSLYIFLLFTLSVATLTAYIHYNGIDSAGSCMQKTFTQALISFSQKITNSRAKPGYTMEYHVKGYGNKEYMYFE